MKVFSIVLCYLVLVVASYGDDLRLRNGIFITNCVVADTTDDRIIVKMSDRWRIYPLVIVEEVIKKPYNEQLRTSVFENGIETFFDKNEVGGEVPPLPSPQSLGLPPPKQYVNTHPRLFLLPTVVLGAALSIEYFSSASDIQDAIDAYDKVNKVLPQNLQIDTSELKARKSRKSTYGAVFALCSFATALIAVMPEKVELQASTSALHVQYAFNR